MSGSLAEQPIWTPPVIATIVYRVVMIIVSIAFIWKKYRRPGRQLDGNSALLTLTPHSYAHAAVLTHHFAAENLSPLS